VRMIEFRHLNYELLSLVDSHSVQRALWSFYLIGA